MQRFELLFRMTKKPLVRISVFLAIALCFQFLDKPVAIEAHQWNLSGIKFILNIITYLGFGAIYIALFSLVALYFRYLSPSQLWESRMWFLWLCVTVPYLFCFILKVCLGRARPELFFSQNLFGFFGPHMSADYWSFPSGHTTTVMGIVFGMGILFPRYLYSLIATGICISALRIILVKHYVSDVIVAIYFTLILVGLVHHRLWPWFNLNFVQKQHGK